MPKGIGYKTDKGKRPRKTNDPLSLTFNEMKNMQSRHDALMGARKDIKAGRTSEHRKNKRK